ncbi:MAG: hypothetical protein VB108_01275 [Anaerolineaceae bacterium]|nr:hypothetical protein [Anaerolineaceae bacterium]
MYELTFELQENNDIYIFDCYGHFLGYLHNGENDRIWEFFADDTAFLVQDLRAIADKLDELNGVAR